MFHILDALPTEIAILDPDGKIRATNRAWDKVAAKAGLEVPAGGWNYLNECIAAADRGCIEGRDVEAGIIRVIGRECEHFSKVYPCAFDGFHHWFQISASPVPAAHGGGAIVVHTDITGLQHDPLTGLANRQLLLPQLELAIEEAKRRNLVAGFMLIDLDLFKGVNDRSGHLAGDRVLVEVAGRLRGDIRSRDLAVRLGGDEFAVVLGPTAEADVMIGVARRMMAVLNEAYRLDGEPLAVGASAGLALSASHGETCERLMERADAAMYQAKRDGGGSLRVADAEGIAIGTVE